MPPPQIPRLQDGPRLLHGLQGFQRIEQDRPLLLHLKCLPEGVTKRVVKVEGPGRLHLLRDFFLEGDPDGRNPFRLNGSLQQAHGLVAETSGRGEEDSLRPVALQSASHLWCRLLHEGRYVGTVDMPHEAVHKGGDSPDNPFRSKFLEPV